MGDLSTLEVINLRMAGLTSYNFKQHVAIDIGTDHLYLPSENIQSQKNMDNISNWTNQNLKQLNERKSKVMVFRRPQFFYKWKTISTLL